MHACMHNAAACMPFCAAKLAISCSSWCTTCANLAKSCGSWGAGPVRSHGTHCMYFVCFRSSLLVMNSLTDFRRLVGESQLGMPTLLCTLSPRQCARTGSRVQPIAAHHAHLHALRGAPSAMEHAGPAHWKNRRLPFCSTSSRTRVVSPRR
jgi:hypothetical protein